MIRVVHTSRMDGEPINYTQRFVVLVLVKLYLRQNLIHIVPVPVHRDQLVRAHPGK